MTDTPNPNAAPEDPAETELDGADVVDGVEILDPEHGHPDDVTIVDAEIVDSGFPGPTEPGTPWSAPHDLGAHHLGLELPDDPAEAQQLLLRELFEARQEASEYLDTLQRLAADFENYRRRVERDQAENVMRASQRIVEALLPTLDAFDAALAYESQSDAETKLLDGMRGTRSQLIDTLTREGLAPVDANPGTPFDPAVHEAVAGGGDGDLVVGSELRRGYRLRDRLVRPAMVTVEAEG